MMLLHGFKSGNVQARLRPELLPVNSGSSCRGFNPAAALESAASRSTLDASSPLIDGPGLPHNLFRDGWFQASYRQLPK